MIFEARQTFHVEIAGARILANDDAWTKFVWYIQGDTITN